MAFSSPQTHQVSEVMVIHVILGSNRRNIYIQARVRHPLLLFAYFGACLLDIYLCRTYLTCTAMWLTRILIMNVFEMFVYTVKQCLENEYLQGSFMLLFLTMLCHRARSRLPRNNTFRPCHIRLSFILYSKAINIILTKVSMQPIFLITSNVGLHHTCLNFRMPHNLQLFPSIWLAYRH